MYNSHKWCYNASNCRAQYTSKRGELMAKKILSISCLAVMMLVTIVTFSGCTKTIYVPVNMPTSITSNPPTTASTQTWTAGPVNIDYGNWQTMGSGGISIQGGKTLTLTWSADGNLDCFIFTENQYNNFKPIGLLSGYLQHGAGSQGTITVTLQNSDTYYVIVRNQTTFGLVKLYQATLTAR